MLVVLAAVVSTLPVAAAGAAPCERPRAVLAAGAVEHPTVRPLGDMPPAKQILA